MACVRLTDPRPGVHNLFALASRITFRFMNYGLQWVQDTYIFCIASVLHAHTKSGLLAHVRFATKYPHTVDEEFLLMHGPHSYCAVAFQLHAHGRINFYRRPWPDVARPCPRQRFSTFLVIFRAIFCVSRTPWLVITSTMLRNVSTIIIIIVHLRFHYEGTWKKSCTPRGTFACPKGYPHLKTTANHKNQPLGKRCITRRSDQTRRDWASILTRHVPVTVCLATGCL